jgi:hypothetical protein
MDHTLGEHDSLTMIDALHDEPLPDDLTGLRPLVELPSVVESYRARAYPPPGQLPLPTEGEWSVLRGTIDDGPALVLANTGLRPFVGHPSYDRCLIVSILLNEVTDDGMPATGEELEMVQSLADQFAEALADDQQSLYAAIVTTGGRRDLILYTSDLAGSLKRVEELRQQTETHRIESSTQFDTFWSAYRSFVRDDEEGDEDGSE